MSKVLIVGGGAAGMMAGVFAARNGHEVHILEKMRNWGRNFILQGKAAVMLQITVIRRSFFRL